jgi:2'-5' RNA ligase
MRLFFALQPSAEQSEALLAQIAPSLAAQQVSLIPPGNLHATLCFLGAVAREKLPALCEAAARVRSRGVSIHFDALEFWPKPKIVCATASEQCAASASALARTLSDAVVEAGFTPDIKPFRAHLTLARKVRVAQAAALAFPQSLSPGFVVRCSEFALMESRRGEAGSIYSVVARWPLYEKQEH